MKALELRLVLVTDGREELIYTVTDELEDYEVPIEDEP